MTALLEYLNLLCLQVAIAAGGDYPLVFLCATVVKQPQATLLQWAANAKSILAVRPSFAAD